MLRRNKKKSLVTYGLKVTRPRKRENLVYINILPHTDHNLQAFPIPPYLLERFFRLSEKLEIPIDILIIGSLTRFLKDQTEDNYG